MQRTNTIIIGGGQAGLATSRCLGDRGIDHVVLERGQIAQSWRTERWDSLRLLTPNWQSRLPGWSYQGGDPNGYMTMPETIAYLERYAASFDAPVQTDTSVMSVERIGLGFKVATDRGVWLAGNVVVATGYCGKPNVPAMADDLYEHILQMVPTRYRNPNQLPEGGVLVVGASASGLQLAEEIQASGRPVTLAVGRHIRLPRSYRGRDIMWWLDRMGVLDETIDEVYSVEASRSQPSLQLVGRPDHETLDLGVLQDSGVRLVGRARAVSGSRVLFTDDLAASTAEADAKLARILLRVDSYIDQGDFPASVPAAEKIPPVNPAPAPTAIDLDAAGINTVLWATGFNRSYPWLKVPVLDERGEIRHHGGVTPVPGLYVIGLNFLRRRKSTYIDGVGDDARDLAAHIAGRDRGGRRAAA
jgi:putative flavoprotein involved in K+ transport